jgi:hypothetical protein
MTEPVAVLANAYKTVAFQPAGIQAGSKQTGRSREPENNDGQEIQKRTETKIKAGQQHSTVRRQQPTENRQK